LNSKIKRELKRICKECKLTENVQNWAEWVWKYIAEHQALSEDTIREFKDKWCWDYIAIYQALSEDTIREFKDKWCWSYIAKYQPLSETFCKEMDIPYYADIHKQPTMTEKRKAVKAYAEKYGLEYNSRYLYAYRNHDKCGRGKIKLTRYKKGIYYRDWHCDHRANEENSFGFGIWPKGNTKVRIKISDWGVAVNRGDGKARVWGFTII